MVQKETPCGRPATKRSSAESGRAESKKNRAELFQKLQGQLTEFCEIKKLNRSGTRETILRAVVSEQKHWTAQDLVKAVQELDRNIGPATIYRNLPVLVQSGILEESFLEEESGSQVYELATVDHHDHVVCLDCSAIIEFKDESIEARQEAICQKSNFTLAAHRHVIYARCNLLKKTAASR